MIVLNGGSSSGKSGIAHCLQSLLPDPWLSLGVDTFVDALPPALGEHGDPDAGGLAVGPGGEVRVGAEFRRLESAWIAGIAAMVRAGARVVVDEVFLGGAASQERWRAALGGLDVLWVGVRCDPAVAAGRETARGDRAAGMAAGQAGPVHRGVHYDLEVDTTRTEAVDCARLIIRHLAGPVS
ncbi:chloramphenicol phosphotransferase CPT [Streptomyces qinzhouensis]|uniref:Chloramphenicol phosphotransferase CPT n=1 Tax=Streptomyces qinzhouensis TaxID=2599401 RepID=A0A5B8JMY5_9ACTN|nr:chloramphenicol phosphotransferase CPT [Streptomyces qinzhouensis]QDY81261.1 chloramphenicol phosphotransferase CPT [Streptomyces qinzhouensis]